MTAEVEDGSRPETEKIQATASLDWRWVVGMMLTLVGSVAGVASVYTILISGWIDAIDKSTTTQISEIRQRLDKHNDYIMQINRHQGMLTGALGSSPTGGQLARSDKLEPGTVPVLSSRSGEAMWRETTKIETENIRDP